MSDDVLETSIVIMAQTPFRIQKEAASVLEPLKPRRISLLLLIALVGGGCAPKPGSSPSGGAPSSNPSSGASSSSKPAVGASSTSRPAATTSSAGTPGPKGHSGNKLIDARKAIVSGGVARRAQTTVADRTLARRKALRLTSDQVRHLETLKRDSAARQKTYLDEIAASRKSAAKLAEESTRGGSSSLKEIRMGLSAAGVAQRRLEAERDRANREAAQILSPGQREALKRETR